MGRRRDGNHSPQKNNTGFSGQRKKMDIQFLTSKKNNKCDLETK
jgi:hypothetical protein